MRNQSQRTEKSLVVQVIRRTTSYALHTVLWKHLQIAIALCRHFKIIAFILGTVMETQLLINLQQILTTIFRMRRRGESDAK